MKKRGKMKKYPKNEKKFHRKKMKKAKLENLKKKIQKISERFVNKSVWHGCTLYTHFQWPIQFGCVLI